jgi:signal peptidase I
MGMNSENAKRPATPPSAQNQAARPGPNSAAGGTSSSGKRAAAAPGTPRRGSQPYRGASGGSGGTDRPAGERKRGVVGEWARSLGGGILIFLVVRTFLLQTFAITSGSMEHTLLVGDFLLLSKSAYGATIPGTTMRTPGYSAPRHGDVIVFSGHHEPLDLVKRLIGMPGDTIAMEDGVLFRNGVRQDEPYVERSDPGGNGWHPGMDWQVHYSLEPAEGRPGRGLASDGSPERPTRDTWGPLVVPHDHYFVLGDNRDDSLDSRYYGFISHAQVKGRVVGLYFSYDRDAYSKVPVLGRVRWDRVGDRLK